VTRWVVAVLADEARLRDVDVHLEAEPVPTIVADRVQVEQVLVNLIRNGIEAAESAIKEKQVWVRLRLSGAGVQIVVEDSGPALRPKLRSVCSSHLLPTNPAVWAWTGAQS